LKTAVTDIGSWKRRVEVEVEAEEVRPYMEEAYRSYQKKVHVEGFRKGRAPLSLVRQRFGERIRAEVSEDLIQTFFQDAIRKEKLAIVSPGTVQEFFFEEDKPLRFTAEVEVEPVVDVTSYKGLKVEKEVVKVTPEDVQRTLDVLRERRAERKPVKGGSELGHIIEGDVQALGSSGVPIIGQKWENRSFEMGSPPLGDLIQDQLLGVVAGEVRRFKIVQPEKGPDGKIKDREDHYSIKVKSIQEKILPELDDNFAKEVGEFQTVSDLEEDIYNRLEVQRNQEAERLLRNRVADEIVKRNDFEVPPSMVENALKGLWEDYRKRSDKKEVSEDQFRQENRASVVWNIKWHLIWQKIAEVEGIAVTEEEVDEEIGKLKRAFPKEEKKIQALFKDSRERRRLKENLSEEKVMGFLKEHAKIKEVSLKPPKNTRSSIITS